MTEFETLEAIHMFNELAAIASMNFVAILFAYIVASHFAGQNLPKGIALGLTVIYSFFQATHLIGTYSSLENTWELIRYLKETFPSAVVATGDNASFPVVVTLFCVPMLLAWAGSIFYLHFHIRSKSSGDA